jgi:hypothetical protein
MSVLMERLHGMLARPLHPAQEVVICGIFGAAMARCAVGCPLLSQRFYLWAITISVLPLYVRTCLVANQQIAQRRELAKLLAIAFFGTFGSFVLGILILTGSPRLALGIGSFLSAPSVWPVFCSFTHSF